MSARDGTEVSSGRALGHLCESYWYSLYAFVRRSGKSPEDAADLTQGLFESLIAHSSLAGLEEERGRFRSFLIGAVKNFMADQWARSRTEKRGAGALHFSIELDGAERQYSEELRDDLSADQIYDRRWALTVLETVFQRLGQEYDRRDKEELFDAIKGHLEWNSGEQSYAKISGELNMSVRAVEQAVYRMRQRYRHLLEEEVGHTVASREDLRSELEALVSALGV